jgi:uncharacterized pyridoxal phosphate-containing UPF0001 family protein
MTIGALERSVSGDRNEDFGRLKETGACLQRLLEEDRELGERGVWGEEGKLVLSMGMSGDFKAALRAGSDMVRVGTGIFGARARNFE